MCPLCQTKVYHPDLTVKDPTPTYPKKDFQSEAINRKGILFVISILYLLPLLLPMLFEFLVSDRINWSGIVAAGTLLSYLFFILPAWFKKKLPMIFVPVDFLGALLTVWYICYATNGNWFFTFALPITALLGAIITAVTVLVVTLRRGRLYIVGSAIIATGGWTVLIEKLLHVTFGVRHTVYWSAFTLSSFFILGMMLIIIAIVKPWKESLRRFFFLD